MRSRDFCFWLQGFFELQSNGGGLDVHTVEKIKAHLSLVFKHEIDPSIHGGKENPTKFELDQIHHPHAGPSDQLARC